MLNCSQSPVGVHDEGVAAVLSAELHHQSELVHPAGGLEQRHQLVLVHVSGNLPHKHLAAPRRRRALPACSADTLWVTLQTGSAAILHSLNTANSQRFVTCWFQRGPFIISLTSSFTYYSAHRV